MQWHGEGIAGRENGSGGGKVLKSRAPHFSVLESTVLEGRGWEGAEQEQ